MNDIWRKWERHYQQLGITEDICKDGMLNEEVFRRQDRRILFVMKDTDQAPGIDLRDFLKDGPRYPMWHITARWAAAILRDFPGFDKIDDLAVMKDALSKVAVINLKKPTGGAAADIAVVNAYAHQDRDLLVEQIEAIRPTIIVACGTIGPLMWLLDLPVHPSRMSCPVKYTARDAWVIPWRHPARASNRATYEALSDLVGPLLRGR